MNVSIILPLHKPDYKILQLIKNSLKQQKFNGKKEIIFVNEGLGLAASLNLGIKKSKYPIIVSLHQDCIPASSFWLQELVNPLQNNKVVASVSKVELPKELWLQFDSIAKILSSKEQRILTPLLDEKGCAYKKEELYEIGLFNEKDFRTAGEDFDIYLKLKKRGNIAYPNIKVIHYHFYDWKKRLKKELQLSNGFGALARIYGKEIPGWWKGLLKATPVLGYFPFLLNIEVKSLRWLAFPAVLLLFFTHAIYSYGFWKGFLIGKQTV